MGRSITPDPSETVELPFEEDGQPNKQDYTTAIIYLQSASMEIPSLHVGRYIKPSIMDEARFSSLSIEDFQDIIKNCKPFLVNESINRNVPRVMIHLTHAWQHRYVIHMFPARTD
jgi:hypothetical protein